MIKQCTEQSEKIKCNRIIRIWDFDIILKMIIFAEYANKSDETRRESHLILQIVENNNIER